MDQETRLLGLFCLSHLQLPLSLQVKNFLSKHRGTNRTLSALEPSPGEIETDSPIATTGSHDSMVSGMNNLNLKELPNSVPEKCANLPERIRAHREKVKQAQKAGTPSESTLRPPQTPETSPFRNQKAGPNSAWFPGPRPQRNQVRHWDIGRTRGPPDSCDSCPLSRENWY